MTEIERECLFILFIYWLIIVYIRYDIEKKEYCTSFSFNDIISEGRASTREDARE